MKSLLILTALASSTTCQLIADESSKENVVAVGAGTSRSSALDDAFQEAVRKAIGLIVEAETIVENDQLIKEKILTYSGGYITSYDVTSENQAKGIWKIEISAEVTKSVITERLKALNVSIMSVDGKSLAAEAVTKMNMQQSKKELFTKAFDGFPYNIMRATAQEKTEAEPNSDGNIELTVRAILDIDRRKYHIFAKKLSDVASDLASTSFSFSVDHEKDAKGWMVTKRSSLVSNGVWTWLRRTNQMKPMLPLRFVVTKRFSPDYSNFSCTCYGLETDLAPVLSEVYQRRIFLAIVLLDKNGQDVADYRSEVLPFEISSTQGNVTRSPLVSVYEDGYVHYVCQNPSAPLNGRLVATWLRPTLNREYESSFAKGLKLNHTFTLTREELESVADIQFRILPE